MDIETKTFEFEIKELSKEGTGTFSGILSPFGNIDAGRDIVEEGAFSKTLKENKAFPLTWAHIGSDPSLIVGTFYGEEKKKGLKIEGEFFGDDSSQEVRQKIKSLFEKGIKIGLSIGYKTVKYLNDTINGQMVRRLKEVKLNEGAFTLFPMNELARVEEIKEDSEVFEYEKKPFPSEHSCRLQNPDKFERFVRMKRKHDGKEFSVIIGFKKGGGSEDQAYRYPKDTWSAEEARKHCKDHDGSFEAAKKEKSIKVVCTSCGETLVIEPGEESTLKKQEPSQQGLFAPVIEELEKAKKSKPREHLFSETVKILEKN
jgi:HK97 family phage prohead protease